MSSSFKVKPLVLAVSALAGLMSAYQVHSVPQSIVISTSTSDLTLDTINYPELSLVEVNSAGTISASVYGINNSTTIGTLTNVSTITSSEYAIYNSGTLGTISNSGTISGYYEALYSYGSIGTLYNSGLITSTDDDAIYIDDGNLDYLLNTGTISGEDALVLEYDSTIGTINNSGLMTGLGGIIVADGANLGALINSGTISGEYAIGLFPDECVGTLGSISNSGLISGSYVAIGNEYGELGPIYNQGTIAGNIISTSGLSFYGVEGEGFGTLTGYESNSMGYISMMSGDLTFVTGNMLLNDNIEMNEGEMINQAANLQINNLVSLAGDYQQNSEGSLLFGVSSYQTASTNIGTYDGYGRLLISGTATLDSGSGIALMKLGNFAFADGQRYVLIQADADGTDYHADLLNYSAEGYTGLLTGSTMTDSTDSTKTDLVLTLGTDGPNNHATTSNATAALGGLFNYGGTDAKLLNVFNASAALGSTGAANRAGAQLSPAAVASAAAQASAAPSVAVINVIAERGEAIRLAGDGARGVATGEGEGPVAWGQGFGGSVDQGNRYGISGYDATYGGLLLGGDGAINDEWRLGGLGSYANTLVDSKSDNAGSSVRVNSWGMFGYANYDGHPWIMNLSTGAVRHQYDTHRHIVFTGFNGDATGAFHGMQYIAAGQVGYPMQLGSSGALLTPLAGVTYSLLNQDGYTESGGNGAGLTVDSATATSLKSDFGFKLEKSFEVSSGIVHPFMQLGWRHEYHDTALQSVANFSADSSGATSFATQGLRTAADSGVWSVGAMMVGKHNLSLTLKYTGEAARNYQSHTGNVQLRWQF